LREAVGLYRLHAHGLSQRVAARLAETREVEELLERALGAPLIDKRILDVGAGQGLFHMAYFGRQNQVTGIDLEVIAQGMDLTAYARMWRANGARRTVKSAARKLLQVDRRYRQEVIRQCELERFPHMNVLQMDAEALAFDEATFDVVHARSVFQHIPSPSQAVNEIVRVLRPGGVAYVSFHLYTSDTGSLDPRVMRDDSAMPLWPHLRPSTQVTVLQNAFLNKLRLAEWRTLFAELMPGSHVATRGPQDEARLRAAAIRLQAQGELTPYALDELLTRRVSVIWRKP
jgi:SAM-dependent methyltransferase